MADETPEQISQQAIHQPRLQAFLAGLEPFGHLLEGDLQLIEAFVARFVDARRLAGRPHEHA